MIQIAAFWRKDSRNGRTFYQGKSGNGKLLLFKNDKKQDEKRPALVLCIAQETGKNAKGNPKAG
jgi:hypothetical protein